MAELRKVHGSDNSFFILDQTKLTKPLSTATLAKLAQNVCDRQTGYLGGADGILVIDAAPDAAGRMTVVNADGTIAKMCGNGIRTVTRYLSEENGQTKFTVQTEQAPINVSVGPVLDHNVRTFSASIEPVSFAPADLPFANLGVDKIVDTVLPAIHPTFKFTAIAVPNPHLIAFVPEAELAGSAIETIGKQLNTPNPYFPEGVNVTFATIEGPNTLFARTYERGVGFTNACGTGMSATSLAFVLTNHEAATLGQLNTVYNPGGMVQTVVHQEADGRYWIELIGNATELARIEVPERSLQNATFAGATHTLTGEDAEYAAFVATLPYRDLFPAL